jgi:LAGLIDADG endonuclease
MQMQLIDHQVPLDPGFGHWLAGFADGEGCFLMGKNGNGTMFCSFRIALHHEDEPILQEIRQQTGLGNVIVQYSPVSSRAPRNVDRIPQERMCAAS